MIIPSPFLPLKKILIPLPNVIFECSLRPKILLYKWPLGSGIAVRAYDKNAKHVCYSDSTIITLSDKSTKFFLWLIKLLQYTVHNFIIQDVASTFSFLNILVTQKLELNLFWLFLRLSYLYKNMIFFLSSNETTWPD